MRLRAGGGTTVVADVVVDDGGGSSVVVETVVDEVVELVGRTTGSVLLVLSMRFSIAS